MDVCSEYPYVCKYGKYPKGHPQVVTENFPKTPFPYIPPGADTPLETQIPYFGKIKCRVLPPTDLLHPVLPAHFKIGSSSKLLFALCNKCAETQQKQEVCQCSDEERAITGTWDQPELQKALDMGYVILEWIEVWHYPETEQYDPETKTGGLFTSYINDLLVFKVSMVLVCLFSAEFFTYLIIISRVQL